MISLDDSRNTIEFNKFYIIYPSIVFINKNYQSFIKKFKGKRIKKSFSYSSNNNKFLTVKELKNYLENDD